MSRVTTATPRPPDAFGRTSRVDAWWLAPLLVFVGLMIFIVYSTWAGLQNSYFEIRPDRDRFAGEPLAPYLSPFYSPLVYDAHSPPSPHAWIKDPSGLGRPTWWTMTWMPFSAAMFILWGPGLFRLTCYYYRKAYYRAFWVDPPACAVGEPRQSYWGENRWPLLLQNAHRFTMYVAVVFLVILWMDVVRAFWWPSGGGGHQVGMGLGTVIMLVNVVLLTGFTLGCNSVRHLVGGRLNCFNCAAAGHYTSQLRPRYRSWRMSTFFNNNHMLWAWLSLFSVGFADLYIRLCAMGIWNDRRFF